MWRTARKKLGPPNSKRSGNESKRTGFCSKFEWSARNYKKRKKRRIPRQRRRNRKQERGTRHDHPKTEKQGSENLDDCRGIAYGPTAREARSGPRRRGDARGILAGSGC